MVWVDVDVGYYVFVEYVFFYDFFEFDVGVFVVVVFILVDGDVELEFDVFVVEGDGFVCWIVGDVGFLDDGGFVWFGGVFKGWEEFDVEFEVVVDIFYMLDELFFEFFLNVGYFLIGWLFGFFEDDFWVFGLREEVY